jgi:uncharacterized protein
VKKMAKFEILKNSSIQQQQYYWHLKADNGEIIARGENYVTKQGCIDCINLIKRIAATTQVSDLAGYY